jgi:hypothetical protein
MTSTDCYDMDVAVPKLAIGYTKERGPRGTIWRNNLYKHVIRGGPAGGGFSTVEDLLRFAEALRAGKLLAPANHRGALERETRSRITELRLWIRDRRHGVGSHRRPWRGVRGHQLQSRHLPRLGFTAVVLSNYDEGGEPVSQKIRELISRLEPGPREAR